MPIKKWGLLCLLFSLFLLPAPIHAAAPATCSTADGTPGIPTALGCLGYYPETFIRQIVPWGVRLAGGVAFFLILLAAFQYSTATGDPEKTKAAQELLTSAFAGLIIIIFATILLYTIGVELFDLDRLGF